jgi:hypothetical protein
MKLKEGPKSQSIFRVIIPNNFRNQHKIPKLELNKESLITLKFRGKNLDKKDTLGKSGKYENCDSSSIFRSIFNNLSNGW